MPSTAEILASVVGGGLQGFVQGRQAKMQRESAKAQQARQFKMDQSREDRQRQKQEMEVEKRNQEISGQKEFTGLLNAISGMSDRTPSNEFMQLSAQAIDAANRGGLDLKTARNLIDQAILAKGIEQPMTAEEQAKLTKAEADAARAQEAVGTEQERKKLIQSRRNKLNAEVKEKPLANSVLNGQVSLDQLNAAQLRALSKDFSDLLNKYSANMGGKGGRKALPGLQESYNRIATIANEVNRRLQMKVQNTPENPQQLGPLGPTPPGLDQFPVVPMSGAPANAQAAAQSHNQQNKRKEAEDYLKQNNLPVTENNINFYLNSVK